MRILFFTILNLLFCAYPFFSSAQEFPQYSNGLIYSPEAMKYLRIKVDSLHSIFSQAIFSKIYQTSITGNGIWIQFEFDNVKKCDKLRYDLDNQVSYSEIVLKYLKYQILKLKDTPFKCNKLVNHPNSKNYNYEIEIIFDNKLDNSFLKNSINTYSEFDPRLISSKNKRLWLYDYTESNKYISNNNFKTTYFCNTIYLDKPVLIKYLPQKYDKLINYAQFMVDSNTKLFEDYPYFKIITLDSIYDSEKAKKNIDSLEIAVLEGINLSHQKLRRNGPLYMDYIKLDSHKIKQIDIFMVSNPIIIQKLKS